MSFRAEVLENTRKSDGTINTLVKVTAINRRAAAGRGVVKALRHNGYSSLLIDDESGGSTIDIDVVDVRLVDQLLAREVYEVDVKIQGATQFL